MELRWIEHDSQAYRAAAKLRYRLFYQPHGIDEAIVHTGEDVQDSHAVIEQDGQVLAYGRLAQDNAVEFRVLQMVVEPAWQGLGLGKWLLQALTTLAKQQGGLLVSVNARVTQVGFYNKQGFEACGEIFASASTGVPHISMTKPLASGS